MKIAALFLALLMFAPSTVPGCHCCPAQTVDKTLKIESADCHSCCPQALDIARDSATLKEKQLFTAPALAQNTLMPAETSSPIFALPVFEKSASPPDLAFIFPQKPLDLSAVLRI